MKSILAFRRAYTAAALILTFFFAVPNALATHLRGGTLSWKVTATTSTTYTVQFTLIESQRWSYSESANTNPGLCSTNATKPSGACLPLNSVVTLSQYSGEGFNFGDNATGNPSGTITSINQAQDYASATFVFTHTYSTAGGARTAYFYDENRISGLELGSEKSEYISTLVSNYPNASPVVSVPSIISVPLQSTVSFNPGPAVSDIDPNITLNFRLSTFAEMYGPSSISNLTAVPCPSGSDYKPGGVASGNPPGFTVSSTGVVTWNTTVIANALSASNANCGFGTPKAGDFWAAQLMVETRSKANGNVITQVPIDILMQFINPTGALPTVTITPPGPVVVNIGDSIHFAAQGLSTNPGSLVTLNISGAPQGSTASGLNATVTPPANSSFDWTPTASQAGSYIVTYTVTDSNLQQAQASKAITVATLPTVNCSSAINVPYGSTGTLSANVYDPSNELLNVVWTLNGNTVQTHNNVVSYPTPATDSLTQDFGSVGLHNATATATDPHGVSVSCNTSATVVQADQTIAFGTLPNVPYGSPDFTPIATASSSLTVGFAAAGSCIIDGAGHVHITGAGQCQVTASQPGNTNYNAAPNVVQAFDVTPAAVTATGGSGTAIYDGLVKTPSACTVTGSYTGDLTCTNQPATVGPDVSTTTVVPSVTGTNVSSFNISSANGSYSITQASSTIQLTCPAGVVYNGAAQLPCSATVSGAGTLNQPVTVSYSSNQNAGVATASASYPGDLNHTGSTASTTFNITPAPLTATAGGYTGTYDGAAHALSACVVSSNPSGLTCTNNPVGPVGADVGSGVVVPVLSGSVANYSVTSNNGTWSITPRLVTLTAGSYNGAYDGSAHSPSACTSNYAGVTCSNNPVSVGPGLGSGTVNPIASYATGNAADYSLTLGKGTFNITAASASITPNTASKVYGAADPVLTGATTGFAPADNLVVTYSRTPGQTVAGSPYTISATVAANPALANYNVTYNTALFTITKMPASVTLNPASKTFGAADPALTGTLSGFLPADNVVATYSRAPGETVAGSPYAISANLSPATALVNYNITYNTAALTINKATPTIVWANPAAITYGTALSGTQLNATANVQGSFAYSPSSGVLPVGSQTLSVVFTPTDAADYKTLTASVSLLVNKASTTTTITVTKTQTFSGTTATIAATVTPQISGTPTGTITYMNGTTVLGSAAVGTPFTTSALPVGSNSISAVYSGDANFNSSTSAKTTVTGVAPTTIQLIIPVPTVLYPTPVVYTVIAPLKGLLQFITGTITIYDGNTPISTVPILPLGINAGLTLPPLTAGAHSLRAVYNGDSNYAPGQSPVVTVNVVKLF